MRAFLPLKLAYGPRNEPIYNMNILICGRLQNYDIHLGKLIVTLKLVFYFPRSQISWIQDGKFHLRPVIELFIIDKIYDPFFFWRTQGGTNGSKSIGQLVGKYSLINKKVLVTNFVVLQIINGPCNELESCFVWKYSKFSSFSDQFVYFWNSCHCILN